jgi:2-polyprenyl-3-methyl-5-hydroxy-6-metoxy-1,4-benzoquinol methylase
MSLFTTEITSNTIASDSPLHHRLLSADVVSRKYIKGDVLELGCGEGRGIDIILKESKSFTAIDKIKDVIEKLSLKYRDSSFISSNFPPISEIEDNSFDTVISFQVIEHVKDDSQYISEIERILRPGGVALITTPNIKMTLTRNPWHVREYTSEELNNLCRRYFSQLDVLGISGNSKVIEYYNQNLESVKRFKSLDIFNLEKILPNFIYQIPYEFLNRINRNNLKKNDNELVSAITYNDYKLVKDDPNNLDLFIILRKK